MSTVLVTGGSGFIGGHCIEQLLAAGHDVRTTVRNLGREQAVRSALGADSNEIHDRLAFFQSDLEHDAGWSEATAGCDYVLHVASPFPAQAPKNADELIVPARDGALRVLKAARDANVKRVVLTSSFAAIGYGHKTHPRPFDETDWTLPDGQPAYIKSKTLAERAAWAFMEREGGDLELAVINPVGVFGPMLGPDQSASFALVRGMLMGAIAACPRVYFGMVDVRDVADLHIRAMTNPQAKGERFLATAGDFLPMIGVAKILKERMGTLAKRVPTRQLPDWLVRLAALRDPRVRETLPELGKIKNGSNLKSRSVLGWSPRPNADAIVATAESLERFGLLTIAQ